MTTKRTLACLSLILVLVASACGSSTTAETAAAAATAPAASGAETPSAMPESDSPVENLLGIPIFDEAAMNEWSQNLSREAEVVVAKCMLAEGFEYTPAAIQVTAASDAIDTDSLEYAQTRGFDIVSNFNESVYDPANTTQDKNAIYLATLSESEADAYNVALVGAVQSEEQNDDPFGGGCWGKANEEVFSVVGVLDAIEPVFNGYYDLYISDSRIIATTAQWQECMSAEGYLFGDEDEMVDHVHRQFEAILNDPAAFNEFEADSPDAPNPDGSEGHPGLTPSAQAQMDALGEEELSVAVADWTCREPIKEIELDVQREYEGKFVAEVSPQVQAIRAGE